MDLNTITVADFKAQFFRDFPYLPVYDNTALYNLGDRVYYPTTKLFYDCAKDGVMGVLPTTVTNPISWSRTEPQPSIDDYVLDQDITNAMAEAKVLFNQGLFGTADQIKLGFLYLTAHFLCNDLKASRMGILATAYFPLQSRSVGSVSESYGIPKSYLDNPIYSFYTGSAYGLKYLAMVLPKLVGNMMGIPGRVQP